MKKLHLILVLSALFLCLPIMSYATEVDYGAYVPSVFPDTEVTVWEGSYTGNPVVYIVPDDTQLYEYDALYIDSLSSQSYMAFFLRDNTADNSTDTITFEAKVRLDAYTGDINYGGCAIVVENDSVGDSLAISSNKIRLWKTQASYSMDTTDDYHIYTIVLGGGSIKVYVDDGSEPVIDVAAQTPTGGARNIVGFGDGSGIASSKSSWAYVTYSIDRN